MDWERTSVRADDGTDLAVCSAGPAAGVPFLLVHGFSLDHTTWQPLAESLVGTGFRVVAADLRGHGGSALGTTAPTVDRFVSDLASIVDTCELRAVHLVGHSLGAVVVLAARVSDQLAGSILSVTSIAGTERALQNPVMKLGAKLFSSTLGITLLRQRRAGRVIISSWFGRKSATADLDWIRELSAACDPATRSAVAGATGDVDLRATFADPGPPTMVICGQRDKATAPSASKRIAAAIDGAELHLIEGAGHMVIIEEPEIVADLLRIAASR